MVHVAQVTDNYLAILELQQDARKDTLANLFVKLRRILTDIHCTDVSRFTAMIGNQEIDNRWIVPYCPLLLSIFDAHINVEFCSSEKCIKYICKYINKGCDAASFALAGNNTKDEIRLYMIGRYYSTGESTWRLLSLPIHERHPAIEKLAVHLENDQQTFFNNENAATIADRPRETTLTGFFKLCSRDEYAKTLLYHQIPFYYTWNKITWNCRKNGTPVDGYPGVRMTTCLGRVYTVSPNKPELFYLRLLLHEVAGPTSFEDVRTVDNHVYPTYRAACLARGMLENDSQWDATLSEVALSQPAASVRDLFSKLLFLCHISDPNALWLKYRDYLSNDFLHRAQQQLPDTVVTFNDEIYNQALVTIENNLLLMGGAFLTSYGLREPNRLHAEGIPTFIIQETSYDEDTLSRYVDEMKPKLLRDQLIAYQTVISSVLNRTGDIFFLDAPGGNGKTFVTKLILARVRHEKRIAVVVASSGIAATLLPGGRTAHSTFKLPLHFVPDEKTSCNITKNSSRADLLANLLLMPTKRPTGEHERRFNAPTCNEVSAVIQGEHNNKRDIVIHTRGGGLQRINEMHRSYDALQYPLLFPYGDDGYHFHIPCQQNLGQTTINPKTITCRAYYAYRLMVRDDDFNTPLEWTSSATNHSRHGSKNGI